MLVVYVHWGLEHQETWAYQRTLARNILKPVQMVFGAHSHCLQGIEYIDGKPVFTALAILFLAAALNAPWQWKW
ncbi:MAG: CapA family protein [Clostridium sp.]